MMTQHTIYSFGAGAALAFCLTAVPASAEDVPIGYQPGWQIDARKVVPQLDKPTGRSLANFTAPSSGFDMDSYRGGAPERLARGPGPLAHGPDRLAQGIAYDAQGLLNITVAGPYRIGATVAWGAGQPGPEATCRLSLSLDERVLTEWKGPLSIIPGQRAQQANADLQPGLHPVQLRAACDRPVGARVTVALMMKAPSDRDLRPLGPAEIVHPGSDGPGTVAQTPPPATTPPEQASPPKGATTMIATANLNVRARPTTRSRRLLGLNAGQHVEVAGPASDPAWVRLVRGGFVQSAFLRPQEAAGPARPEPDAPPSPSPSPQDHTPREYKVGECRPYRTPTSGDNGQPRTYGQTCLQADGHWRVIR